MNHSLINVFTCFFFFLAFTGLALVYVVQNMVWTQYAIKKSVEVETLMTSVERVMTYTETILELISQTF